MKKIHVLILKAFIRPFIVTFFIVMFVLLMLFLFKYIDDLIGKGFEWYIIMELMLYASATNVAMALPLAILLSSIMTYGSLGENYELVAIKSAGVSLTRAMYPMIIVVSLLSISAFVFSDYMLPVANLKYYSLLYDARQQKSANLLPAGIFSNSFPGYTIRVKRKGEDGQTLYGVMIYQKNESTGNNTVLFAKEGIMYRSPDNLFLVLKLKDGIRYEESPGEKNYNPRQRFTRFRFKETEQKFDLSGFKLKRTPENDFKSSYQMLNMRQLKYYQDSIQKQSDSSRAMNFRLISPYIKYFNISHLPLPDLKWKITGADAVSLFEPSQKLIAVSAALNEAKSVKDMITPKGVADKDMTKMIRRYIVEYQRKFTLSVACLVLFLIGAPLGALIRKGGLGLPVVVAIIFFLIYHIISTIGEKSAKEGDLPPQFGMWIAIFVLTPLGLFLTYKAATDSVLFDADLYKRFFRKVFQKKIARPDRIQ
ncbi:MAG: LptF/LptG family permease [Sphingobacteriaceae bacterium]